MIPAAPPWLSWLIQRLSTHADNVTPSLRKVLVVGIGTLGLGMGGAFIGLSIYSVWKTGTFSPAEYGAGVAAIIGALATLPLSLAKAMQLAGRPEQAQTEEPQA